MRPVGAFLFGILADRFGRRPTLMLDIICYSVLGFASGFVTSLGALYFIRALFGIAMGGEWGVGASLTMETIPPSARGLVSGLLQAGYPSGYLLASVVYALLFDHIGWRGMFMIGALPALLVIFVRAGVDESPAWLERKPNATQIVRSVTRHLPLFIFVVLLMTAFNFYSHGTQDSYPAFLQVQLTFNFPNGWDYHRHCIDRSDSRRLSFRRDFSADRPAESHRHRFPRFDLGDPIVGLLAIPGDPGGRCVHDAVFGSRGLGSHSCASQRVVTS